MTQFLACIGIGAIATAILIVFGVATGFIRFSIEDREDDE